MYYKLEPFVKIGHFTPQHFSPLCIILSPISYIGIFFSDVTMLSYHQQVSSYSTLNISSALLNSVFFSLSRHCNVMFRQLESKILWNWYLCHAKNLHLTLSQGHGMGIRVCQFCSHQLLQSLNLSKVIYTSTG